MLYVIKTPTFQDRNRTLFQEDRMHHTSKLFLLMGSLNALIAILLGAFGAHGLKARLSTDMMAHYQTGIQYHFYHAIGLIIIGLIAINVPESGMIKWSGWIMFAGILLFSGSLYILSISGMRWLGAITPIGGTAFIIAWALIVIDVLRQL
jgi:uncharacterized membrane protein YgdD (TMEM256/DUF423 family)